MRGGNMADAIVLGVIVILAAMAVAFLVKEKKKRGKCLGCPFAGTCSKKNADSSCNH